MAMDLFNFIQDRRRRQTHVLQPPADQFRLPTHRVLEGLGFQEQIRATVLVQAKDVSARFTNGLLFNQRMGNCSRHFGDIHRCLWL